MTGKGSAGKARFHIYYFVTPYTTSMVILCISHTKFKPESEGYFSEIVLNILFHQPSILNTSKLHKLKEYYLTVNINNKVRIRMDKKHERMISISYW